MSELPLPPRQAEVLDYMVSCWSDGWIPTIRDIQDKFGFASPNSPALHLAALVRKGYVARRNGPKSGFRLTPKALPK